MNRRRLLSALAALPFIAPFIPAARAASRGLRVPGIPSKHIGDGVALKSVAHPRLYVSAGETVTCQNGHPICDFVETVQVGEIQDVKRQLGNWRQEEPVIGSFPVCARCGAQFTSGGHYHIGEDWRTTGEVVDVEINDDSLESGYAEWDADGGITITFSSDPKAVG